MTFTVTATSSTRMRRLADGPSLRTPRNRWQSPTLRLSAPWGFSLTLKSSSVWEGTREKGISQWSSIFTGARAGAPLLESPPPPPARDGGGKCGCQSLQPCHPAQSCAVSRQSSKLPGARGEGLCRLLPSPCGDDPVFMPLSAATKQLGPGWLGHQRRGGAPRVWSRWAAVCAESGLPSACDPLKVPELRVTPGGPLTLRLESSAPPTYVTHIACGILASASAGQCRIIPISQARRLRPVERPVTCPRSPSLRAQGQSSLRPPSLSLLALHSSRPLHLPDLVCFYSV